MSEASDYLLGIRNGANINQLALASVIYEAQGYIEVLKGWPESTLRDALVANLNREIVEMERLKLVVGALEQEAEQAAAVVNGGPVPEPPPPPEIGTGNVNWSTRDW